MQKQLGQYSKLWPNGPHLSHCWAPVLSEIMKYATRNLVRVIGVSKSQELLLKVRRLFIFFDDDARDSTSISKSVEKVRRDRRPTLLSVCLSLCRNRKPCKTAEPIKMPFGVWTRVCPRKYVLDGGYTLAQLGEHDCIVHVRRRYGLFVKLLWPLVRIANNSDYGAQPSWKVSSRSSYRNNTLCMMVSRSAISQRARIGRLRRCVRGPDIFITLTPVRQCDPPSIQSRQRLSDAPASS